MKKSELLNKYIAYYGNDYEQDYLIFDTAKDANKFAFDYWRSLTPREKRLRDNPHAFVFKVTESDIYQEKEDFYFPIVPYESSNKNLYFDSKMHDSLTLLLSENESNLKDLKHDQNEETYSDTYKEESKKYSYLELIEYYEHSIS